MQDQLGYKDGGCEKLVSQADAGPGIRNGIDGVIQAILDRRVAMSDGSERWFYEAIRNPLPETGHRCLSRPVLLTTGQPT